MFFRDSTHPETATQKIARLFEALNRHPWNPSVALISCADVAASNMLLLKFVRAEDRLRGALDSCSLLRSILNGQGS